MKFTQKISYVDEPVVASRKGTLRGIEQITSAGKSTQA
jgi:hypothetical protein